jgi:hypothetical protein
MDPAELAPLLHGEMTKLAAQREDLLALLAPRLLFASSSPPLVCGIP